METQDQTLTGRAMRGSLLASAQTAINKIAALACSIILARVLAPSDYGVAFTATSIGAFAFVLAPWVLNDLLVSDPPGFERRAGTAFVIGAATSMILASSFIVAIPLLRSAEPEAPWFALLLAIVALRPIADAWMAVPWAALRLDLNYRKIAKIDCISQLAGTAAAIALALCGAGPFALVAPPIAVLFAQGAWYWMAAPRKVPMTVRRRLVPPLLKRFTIAASGQYLNNVVKIQELLILTWVASTEAVGLFAFAFQLSSQANVIVANQVSAVLQPILSHLNGQSARQYAAFQRALRLIGCVGVPLSVLQAAVAFPVFRLLFGAKWDSAIPVFVVLSMMQAFIFVATPIMVLLKAQGRFKLVLVWQLMHLAASAVGFVVLAGPGVSVAQAIVTACRTPATESTVLPVAAATAGTIVWAIGCPLVLWLAGKAARATLASAIWATILPWPPALIAGACVAGLPTLLTGKIGEGPAFAVSIGLSVPLGFCACIAACASDAQCRRDLQQLLSRRQNRP
jgi:O-antigen/teichoic acid export membrane protein